MPFQPSAQGTLTLVNSLNSLLRSTPIYVSRNHFLAVPREPFGLAYNEERI